jgi:hypothetical protein
VSEPGWQTNHSFGLYLSTRMSRRRLLSTRSPA